MVMTKSLFCNFTNGPKKFHNNIKTTRTSQAKKENSNIRHYHLNSIRQSESKAAELTCIFFNVLLTVHLTIFISVINQLDAQNFCFTVSLFHASTCFEHHVLIIRRSKLYYTGCVIQFWPPDDEHGCSKHVEAWNKLIVKQKFCASSWLITEINDVYVLL